MKLEKDGVVWEFKEDDPSVEIFKKAGYEEVKEAAKPAKPKTKKEGK